MYNYQHGKDVNVGSIAQLTSIVLYGRRFFPYYTFNILGGLDEQGIWSFEIVRSCSSYILIGVGAVYSFDPVGSFEREPFRAGGSGASLIQPFLDNQVFPTMVASICSTVFIRLDERTLSGIALS